MQKKFKNTETYATQLKWAEAQEKKDTYKNQMKELEQEINEILIDQEIENDIKPREIRCPYYGCGATFPSSILHDTEFCPECEEPFDHDDIELHLE